MAETITIRTASSTEAIKIAVPGPQGPKGDKGDPGDVAGLPLTTQGDTLYRGASQNERLAIGSTGQVLKVSAQGLPTWANESGAVSSVAGRTGAITLVSVDISSEQVLEVSEAGDANCNGVFVYGGDFNGRPTYYKDKDTFVYWDNVWNISHNSDDQYVGTNTSRPWQAVWSLGSATGNLPIVEQLNGQEYEKAVGQRTNPTAFGTASGKNVGTGANDVAAGNHAHSAATQSVAGFLSAADKTKLDGIASGATVNTASNATPAALGTAAAGASTEYARADHVHAMPTPSDISSTLGENSLAADLNYLDAAVGAIAPSSSTPQPLGTAAAGASTEYARADHVHAMPTAEDLSLGSTDNVTFGFLTSDGLEFAGEEGIIWTNEDGKTNTRTNLGLGNASTADIGTGAGEVAAGNHTHELTTLAATGATNGHVLTANGSNGVTFAALPASGVTTGNIDNAILRADGTGGSTSQSSDLIVDDPVVAFACTGDASTDIITAVGHNFVENQRIRFQSLTGGSGLFSGGPASSTVYFVRNISGNTFQVSTTSGGAAVNFTTNITAGAVLAIQRNLTLRTKKQAFAMTADAATDVITATGHTFVNGDAVSFYNLAGGAGLDEVSRWYVIEASTNTFKVSNSLNGTARDITTSYTGGTVELEIPLVLGLPRSSALILGDKPDGTIIGGNVRGYGAVDLQTNRNGQNAVASGTFSFIGNGQNNTASGLRAVVVGGTGNTASTTNAVVIGGEANGASGVHSIVCGGSSNNATAQWACIGGGTENANGGVAAFVSGASNTATGGQSAIVCGRNALADRENALFQATGRFGAGNGDAQTVRVSLRNRASTATPVELFMGFSADTRFTIPSGKIMSALIHIIAATSGGEFANRYVRAVTIANRGGTTALRGAVKDIDTEEQIGGADVTISANDTNDAIRIEFSGVAPVTGCTGTASTDRINKVAHGYSNNDDIVFTSLTGGAGLTANTVTYWVINANADDFQVSATRGGAAVNITTDYTDMTAARLFRVVAGIDAVELGHGT